MAGAKQPRNKKTEQHEADELRRRAEELLDGLSADAAASPVPEDIAADVHELRVHQIELEMQNEELRRAQLELEAQRQKYLELFDQAPVGYLTLSDEGLIGDANLTAAHLLGVERQLLTGQPFAAFVLAADRDALYLHQRELRQKGKPQTCELRLQRAGDASGDAEPGHFWAHLEGRLPREADGKPSYCWVTFTDIDERKQVEKSLAAAAGQWRETFDAMSASVGLLDLEGRVLRCNAATTVLTGRSYEDLVGRRCFEVFHGATTFLPGCPRRRALDSGQSETSTIEQDGHWLRFACQPLVDEGGAVSGGVCVITDVSELKHAEQGLLESLTAQQAIADGVVAALTRTVEIRDPYTAGHQRRVAELSVAMALHMGLSEDRTEGLRVAGMLHDVGKSIIPAEILSKPGPLSVMQFELVKGHAQAGFEILNAIPFPWLVAEMTLQHHERQDGSGYPAGLKGDEILPEARILAVADAVEAMASHRPYRPALGIAAALAEVRSGAGTRYDADVVAACEHAFERGFVCTQP